MGFDDLWEKYGEVPKSKEEQRKSVPFGSFVINEKEEYKKDVLPKKIEKPSSYETTKRKSPNRTEDLVGVFGDDNVGEKPQVSRKRKNKKQRRNLSIRTLGTLPWVDIICITITITGIIGVIVNFESVTDYLFSIILPIISSISVLIFVIVAIILFIWWLRSRRRRW